MKKLVSLLLALVLCLGLAVTASAAEVTYAVTGGNLYFDTSTGTITGCDSSVTAADIPAKINGVAVTTIGDSAFKSCKSLTSVTFPSCLRTIENQAFAYTGLTSVVVPDSVTLVEYSAFYGCQNLTTATIGAGTIQTSAFSNCTALTEVTVTEGTINLGSAFMFCTALTKATINAEVIGSGVFVNCTALTDITILESARVIDSGAFWGCSSLETVTIEEGLEVIGTDAFYDCTALKTIDIPASVSMIGQNAFYNCSALKNVNYAGTTNQWNQIIIGENNGYLWNAKGLKETSKSNGTPGAAPEFVFTKPNGARVTDQTYDGTTVIIFFQTGDDFSKSFIGNLADSELGNEYDVTFIAAADDGSTAEDVEEFAAEYGNNSQDIVFCTGGNRYVWDFFKAAGRADGYVTSPSAFVVDEDGQIVQYLTGYITLSELEYILSDYSVLPSSGTTEKDIPSQAQKNSLERYNNFITVDPDWLLLDPARQTGEQWDYVREVALEVTAGCKTPEEEIRAVTEYLAKNICYDHDWADGLTNVRTNVDAYDVLVNGYAACGGYTNAFHDMMQTLGIPCGTIISPEHAYNIVYDGSRWIMLDVTSMSNSSMSGGIMTKSDTVNWNWYDFTIDQAINDYNHLILGMPFSVCNGVLESFPETAQLDNYTIPDDITTIGQFAFLFCCDLKSITIPETVTTIEAGAFEYCTGLTTLELPSTLTEIQYGLFSGCTNLTRIVIPDGVTVIEGAAFYGCSSLTEVVIPDSVTTIGVEAFAQCKSLKSITIPDSVTTIDWFAFSECTSLKSIVIPDGITVIEDGLFWGCSALTSISIPASVTMVEDQAFWYTDSLTDVYYGGTKEQWFSIDFGQRINYNLINANIHYNSGPNVNTPDEPDDPDQSGSSDTPQTPTESLKYFIIENGVLTGYTGDEAHVIIPSSVTTIGESVFWGSNAVRITIPDSVTRIESDAFRSCLNLVTVILPDSVTTIGDRAFDSCRELTSVTIPSSVTSIGDDAFRECKSLTSITIPASVAEIGECAFYDCTSLASISILNPNVQIGQYAFQNTPWLEAQEALAGDFVIVNGALISYKGAGGSVTIPSTVNRISDRAFYKCTTLTGITIPSSVTAIGAEAFAGCSALTELDIPDSVTSIGEKAFAWCDGLTSVVIPDSVTELGEAVFYVCGGLIDVTLPKSLTKLGAKIFAGCWCLSDVTIPETVTVIGEQAFNNCLWIESINIPRAVTVIEDWAFYTCYGLTDIYYGGNEEEWNAITVGTNNEPLQKATIHYNWDGENESEPEPEPESKSESGTCGDNLTWTLADGVLTISGSGKMDTYFWNLQPDTPWYDLKDVVKKVVIEPGVTQITYGVFESFDNLTEVSIGEGVERIEDFAFYYCPALRSVTLPASLCYVGQCAFSDCKSLQNIYYSGTEEAWNAIDIYDINELPLNATIHYTAAVEEEVPAPLAYASTQLVELDGQKIELQAYALKDENGNSTNYVKLRDIAMLLNGSAAQFEVGWDGSINLVTGKSYTANGTELKTPFSGDRVYSPGSSPLNINGVAAALDAFVLLDDSGNGYTYFKLRDLGRNLGFNVGWSAARGIFIETDKAYTDAD